MPTRSIHILVFSFFLSCAVLDLVLQGHDHSYGRGSNLPTGAIARDEGDGTVYVVSVSGPKQYKLTSKRWWRRAAENTQLYQTIDVDGDTLRYEARTAASDRPRGPGTGLAEHPILGRDDATGGADRASRFFAA